MVLVVLDGVGVGRGDEFDAVAAAHTPALDELAASGQARTLRAHGPAVGLASDADMGNSEVGHNTLGAGRIFAQGANVVDEAIASGRVWSGRWPELTAPARAGATLHLIGLVSDGRVHASLEHLDRLLERAAEDGVRRVRVHTLLDGRDVPDFTALDYVDELEAVLARLRAVDRDYRIASGGGRMVTTMDRYGANWGVVEAGWNAHVLGRARKFASARAAISTYRAEQPGLSDQMIPPFVIASGGDPVGAIADGDVVILFNFRGDRAIQLSEALVMDDFAHFDRQRVPDVEFAAMTCYDTERNFPDRYLIEPAQVSGTLSEYLAASGVRQFACAETQKFGHVTYFWNGNRAEMFDASTETYVEIPSDPVPAETAPAMKSVEIADVVVAAIEAGRYDFVRTNFAGGDMVGHTADFDATRAAIESIDAAVGRIAAATEAAGGTLVVTADHGNAEDMVERDAEGVPVMDATGRPRFKTAHSTNPVTFCVRDYGGRSFGLRADLPAAGLANVAAGLAELLGFEAPTEYEPSPLTWAAGSDDRTDSWPTVG